MAKKKLTTEQRIEKYKKKKRISLWIKIVISVVVVAMLIPLSYNAYYYVTFTVLPQNSYDPDKITGVGYCKPLHMIKQDDKDSTFVLAYYYDDCWHVVDDSKKLVESRDKFIIYKEDDEWHKEAHLQLMLIKDNFVFNNIPLCEKMLVDDRCFRGCMKKMSMEEFKKYVSDHNFGSVYIQ